MDQLKQILAEAKAANALRVPIFMETLAEGIREHDDARGMLTAFRHAANSIAIEAGVIGSHVPHDQAAKSVLQDVYFLQLIAEAELRFRTLSVRYEKLRAAAGRVLGDYCNAIDAMEFEEEAQESRELADELREVLTDDLK